MKKVRTLGVVAVVAAGVFVAVRYGGSPRTGMAAMGDNSHSMRAHSAVAASAIRTIDIIMADLSFSPDHLQVKRGSTVRLVFHNQGQVAHEAFVGDTAAQVAHENEMAKMADMASMHDANTVGVPAGGSGELTYTFNRVGSTLIACHMPGHYRAGMKLAITVVS